MRALDGLTWPEYENDTKYRMMIGLDMRVEKDPEGERNAAVKKMMDLERSPFHGQREDDDRSRGEDRS